MESSGSQEQHIFVHSTQDSSPTSLIERGLSYIQQGHYADGMVYFRLARQQLSDQNASLAAALDNFMQGFPVYWQAQQQLHHASRSFIELDTLQQERLLALEKLLPEFKVETQAMSTAPPPAPTKTQHHTNGQQPRVSAPTQLYAAGSGPLPALYFTCFGRFEVRQSGQPLTLCSNRNGQAILRYLVVQPDRCASMEALMEAFWPDDEPDIAHHKLQVAVSALRRSLNGHYNHASGGGYVLCRQQTYQLNPAIALRSDLDDFLALYQAGRRADGSTRIDLYERACQFYKGPFLADDLYADWSSLQRGQLNAIYLTMCHTLVEHYIEAHHYEDAMICATTILKENRCDEAAHRHLMLAYAALGRRTDAFRQYLRCQQILFEELGVEPMSETINLFNTLLAGEENIE